MEKIKGASWYSTYSKKIEKTVEDRLVNMMYEELGKEVMSKLTTIFIEKFNK